ncbi:MAG: hypothetical protein SPL43_05185 [Prevotella sp.]|nr:hypothetical protein [Prevotella sp.]
MFVHWVVLPFVLVQCVCVHVAALPDCVHGVAVHAVFWSACVQQVCVLLAWHALALAWQVAVWALWPAQVAAWAHVPEFTIFAFWLFCVLTLCAIDGIMANDTIMKADNKIFFIIFFLIKRNTFLPPEATSLFNTSANIAI